MNRRSFMQRMGLGGAAVAAVGSGCIDVGGTAYSGVWEQRAALLEESSGVTYSSASPGMWAGKEGTHTPSVTENGDGSVTVSTGHPMEENHWINTIFVRDQNGLVIHLVDFIARGPNKASAASTSFRPPAGTTSVTAYSYCNLHDLWVSDPISVG
jgi:desulfoferrodoxin-like iron-binding protein